MLKMALEVLQEKGPLPADKWFADPRLADAMPKKVSIIMKLHNLGMIEKADKKKNWAPIWRVKRWSH